MVYFKQFDLVAAADNEWDRICATPKKVAAMLHFVRPDGSFEGGPFFVFESEEGEALRIINSIKISGLKKEEMPARLALREAWGQFRAATRHGKENYHQKGHAEEFLVHEFPTCLAQAGAAKAAIISISKSPCIGGLDAKPSNNKGVVLGCYNKLIILAAKYPAIAFIVSFTEPFGAFQGKGKGPAAAQEMTKNRISQNINFIYNPENLRVTFK